MRAPKELPEAPPPLPLEQIERKERKNLGKPKLWHPETFQKAPRPSEGKEKYEGKPREARLPKKSTKGHRSSGSKVSANKSSKRFHYSESQSTNICHNLILSSKPNATPRN